MSEAKFKKQVHKAFEKYAKDNYLPLHWQLHEDSLSVGIPDISFGLGGINGWIEAKWDKKMPRVNTIYNPHFQPYQEAWLVARGAAGGNCYLLHGFEDGFMLFNHKGLMGRRPNTPAGVFHESVGEGVFCAARQFSSENVNKIFNL